MKNRLVCECFNIYTDDIKNAIKKGARTFEELEQSMKLGVMCSACVGDSRKVIDEIKKELNI